MKTRTLEELTVENAQLRQALTSEYLSVFHTRDELKQALVAYLEIGTLSEARDYILPRLGILTQEEANILLLKIHDEILEEGRIADVCRKEINS